MTKMQYINVPKSDGTLNNPPEFTRSDLRKMYTDPKYQQDPEYKKHVDDLYKEMTRKNKDNPQAKVVELI